ncbi:MAG: hypothetical protein J4N98_04590 [Chloroflexi bacterium]|nr:hypothetical protein [Chloroflexota bacterium]
MRRERIAPVVRIFLATSFLVGVAAFLWLGSGSQTSTPASAATFQITVGNNWFCDSSFQNGDCELEVAVGDEVTWLFDSAVTHTTTECTGACGSVIGDPGSRLWDSGPMTSGILSQSFDTPGVFQYQCNIHPTQMRGTIIVSGGAPPTLPAPPSPEPSATATSVPTSTPVPAPTSTPPGMRGDVNGDGGINAIDAALVLQFSAGLLPALPSFDRADVNGDGSVNAIDAALILQFSAGLLTTL